MSFSTSISAVEADKFAESVDAATITNPDAESQALFAEAKEAVKALAEKLPKFGDEGTFVYGSISGHAVIADAETSYGYNSLHIGVSEAIPPIKVEASPTTEDEEPSASQSTGTVNDGEAASAIEEVAPEAAEETAEAPEAEAAEVEPEPEATEPEPEPEAVEAEDAPVLTGQAARDEAARLATISEESTGDDSAA